MFFSAIPGKEEVKKQLKDAADQHRNPHARLFLSKEGAGALPMALALASYIMCESRVDGDSCGHCSQCLKSHKYIHPDIHFSYPVVKFGDKKRVETTSDDFLPKWRSILASNPFMGVPEWLAHIEADNTLPNINVKECNDIMHKLNMMSYESDYKILIMWLPEYLGTEGNRLLKLLEEPTENTFLILVSENQEQILQTILSRCQLIKIPSFESEEIKEFLIEKYTIDQLNAAQIANMSEGNINLALNISSNKAVNYADLLLSWFRVAYKPDPVKINEWITVIADMSKEEQKNFFEYGLHFLRQCIFLKLTDSSMVNLTEQEMSIAANMNKTISIPMAESITELLNEAIENVQRNINIKIMLFADTLEIYKIMHDKTLTQ
jgi:DNA polymerase-3 subunit delta'